MKKNKIKKATASRLLAIVEQHETEVLLALLNDITDPDAGNLRDFWVHEACYVHQAIVKFIFAIEHADYSEVNSFDLEKVLHRYQDLLESPFHQNDCHILWFEKKLKKIIARWIDVEPKEDAA